MKTRSLFSITEIIIHCSATDEARRTTVEEIDRWHRERGFDCIGYHYYITRDGEIRKGRDVDRIGAHCKGHNAHSIGICYEGGLDANGLPKDTRTLRQKGALLALLRELKKSYPRAFILGHHDLNPQKECPCFNAASEYSSI